MALVIKEKLKEEEIKEIFRLTGGGNSIATVCKKLNKSKDVIYYYLRERSKSSKIPVRINSTNQENVGEFMGVFAGDGNFLFEKKKGRYTIRLFLNEKEKTFANNLTKNVLIKLFGKKPGATVRRGVLTLRYYSKDIYHFIKEYLTWDPNYKKTYTIQLIKTDHTKDFMIGFIRGSLDSDGHCSDKKINFASTSKGLIYNISKFLDNLNVIHRVRLYKEKRLDRKDVYHIDVPRSEREKFLPLIKPRNIKF